MATIGNPPSTKSIFQFPPNFPNGTVSDVWMAWFQTVQSNTYNYPSPVAGYALGWDSLGNIVNVPNTGADQYATLADTTLATNGAGRIGYNGALAYGASTVGAELNTLSANFGNYTTTASLVSNFVSKAILSDTTNPANGASLVGYLAPYTGAVPRTLAGKNADVVSIKDFGAVGDGTTLDTSAFVAAEAAAETQVFLPDGNYLIAPGTALLKYYTGPGSITVSDQSSSLFLNRHQKTNRPALDSTRIGNLSVFSRAVLINKSATVIIWGDSISEGVNQIAYEDSWAGMLESAVRNEYPGVAWTFLNYSIAGLGVGDANSSLTLTAAGITIATGPSRALPNYTIWPTANQGLSWRDNVKGATPDLIVFAFGQNDTSGDSNAYAAAVRSLYDNQIATWPKIPSMLMVTTIPPTRKIGMWAALNSYIESNNFATRSLADEKNWTLVDPARVAHALREGVDIVSTQHYYWLGFADYPTSWTVISGGPTSTSSTMTFTATSIVLRNQSSMNCNIVADVTLPTGSTAFGIWYRQDAGNPNHAYVAQLTNGTTIILYYNSIAVASATIPTIANGSTVRLNVVSVGANHKVYVNGVKYIDVWDYQRLYPGKHGLSAGGPATVNNFGVKVGYSRNTNTIELLEDAQVGAANDYASNPYSLGGDTIHHPTGIGHYAVYFSALYGFLQTLRGLISQPATPVVYAHAEATAGAIAQGDYIDVTISGAGTGTAMVYGDATHLGASLMESSTQTGTASVVCSILLNGATILLTTTLTLPDMTANWQVMAFGSVSSSGGVLRHAIRAFAFKIPA